MRRRDRNQTNYTAMVYLSFLIKLFTGIVLVTDATSEEKSKSGANKTCGFTQDDFQKASFPADPDVQNRENVGFFETRSESGLVESFGNPEETIHGDDNEQNSDYFTKTSNASVDNYYVFHEGQIDCAVACPKGYFIGDITYGFQNQTQDDLHAHFVNLQDHLTCLYSGLCAETPCSALTHCLSYQACVFKLSNELCKNDTMPGTRKVLHMVVTCSRNDHLLDMVGDVKLSALQRLYLLQKQTFVSYIQAKALQYNDEHVEKVKVDYSWAVVKTFEVPEIDAFDGNCPIGEEKDGFVGECNQAPPEGAVAGRELWTKLARIPDRNHRQELKSVYCAYHYNRQGGCVPTVFASNEVPHQGLVPVRLGFIIMVHKGTMAVLQMLQLILRPQHFYVIHVCRGAETVREEIKRFISKELKGYHNIRVLPYSRSFLSSWGSFEIVRAELECIEELLKMGVWDFVINLSGQDLPLRTMEDLALALAPYRGKNFIRVNFKLDYIKDAPSRSVWHNLGGHVYNVTTRKPGHFDLYSSATWFVLSRDFANFSINPDEGKVREKIFFIQTSMIPDETYFATIMEASRFKGTLVNFNLHFTPRFEGNDRNNLCRHSDDIDYCGMGPRVLHSADVGLLRLHSHRHFFARKFSANPQDDVREQIIKDLAHYNFSPPFKLGVPDTVVRKLAEHALTCLKENHSPHEKNWTLHRVTSWAILPRLDISDPCCEVPRLMGGLVDEFLYTIVFTVANTKMGVQEARASLSMRSRHSCFSLGVIRSMQLSTRLEHHYNPHLPRRDPPDSLSVALPSPTEPAGGHFLWLHLVLHTEQLMGTCAEMANITRQTSNQTYAIYWHTEELDQWDMFFIGTLLDPEGNAKCHREIRLRWTGELMKADVFKYVFMCGVLGPGKWTVNLRQQFIANPFTYSTSVHLADTADYNSDEVCRFWKVTDVAFLPV
ncbi:uncharacterized protein LOC106169376 isoform X2 [Lingula anatina]|uniref:protein xylosyltransferase n=1 Tax=Lingula anatina TaxID=7574 RepID=A0A1S3J1G1_LINAN|nr:uncharacterized protein LOC106169376 isoform X2 [Lingula anatina]|eukprot:XP_013404287.1 uncharacterized protein LOC106169376 isoform X2 [Lingula anatina]